MDARCHAENAIFPLTEHERGACDAALHLSQHTKIELMPNVHINESMELSGFHFEGAGCDTANVLGSCSVSYVPDAVFMTILTQLIGDSTIHTVP